MKIRSMWRFAIFGVTLFFACPWPALGGDPSGWTCMSRSVTGNAPFSVIHVSCPYAPREGPFRLFIVITQTDESDLVLEDVYFVEGDKQTRLDYGVRVPRDPRQAQLVVKKPIRITGSQQLLLHFSVDGEDRVVTAVLYPYFLAL